MPMLVIHRARTPKGSNISGIHNCRMQLAYATSPTYPNNRSVPDKGKVVTRSGLLAFVEIEASDGAKISLWLPQAQLNRAAVVGQAPRPLRRATIAEQRAAAEVSTAAYMTSALSVVVVGASGDLAKKKTYPALLDLFSHGHLPLHTTIVGVARSPLTDDQLREKIKPFLDKLGAPADIVAMFLSRCLYRPMKSYADQEAMGALSVELDLQEKAHSSGAANRLFYFAIPPNVFLDTAVSQSAMITFLQRCEEHCLTWLHPPSNQATIKARAVSPTGFTRLIVEKPFGNDFTSASELSKAIGAIFSEVETVFFSALLLVALNGITSITYAEKFLAYRTTSTASITTLGRRWCKT